MKTESQVSLIFALIFILMALGSAAILFVEYLILINNISHLADPDILSGLLFLTWLALFPIILILTQMRKYVVLEDKLEVSYLFGLIKRSYLYEGLTISDYRWSTKGILIQPSDGDQMTIGVPQYRNFDALKQSLELKIKKEKLAVQYSTKFMRLLMLLGVVALALFIITLRLS
jgi:hypothetical protein